jgi:hypothetical protein
MVIAVRPRPPREKPIEPHFHCVHGCPDPMPAPGNGGQWFCLSCWFTEARLSKMVPCEAPECEIPGPVHH